MIEWRDLRRWFAWAAAVAMASAAMCDAGPWASDKAGSANFAPLSMNAIDRFVSDHLSSDSVPGLALAITQGDRILLVKGYGMARQGAPVTADTQFFIASLSKSFTALAVMQLVDAGQLNLDAPVQRYLPGFGLSDAKAATRITIRQLLNQTSGLADTGFPEGRLPPPATIRQRVATLRRARPVSAPGTAFHYFNPNYAVLARLVEKVSGVPFGDYLHTHIFKPLDMRNTFHAVTSTTAYAKATDLAQGHLAAFGFAVPCSEMKGYLGGSGGVISTARDMAHYLIFQNGGGTFRQTRLVSKKNLDLMHAPPQGVSSRYAMGWFATQLEGQPILEHNGILSVYYADAMVLPKAHIGIALLYNIDAMPAALWVFPRIKKGIIAILTHRPAPFQPVITIRLWNGLFSALILLTVGLGCRSLLHRHQWMARAACVPLWRLLPHFLWWLLPTLLLAFYPALILWASGRSFGYQELIRSMPDISLWLGMCALIGALNASLRMRSFRRSGGTAGSCQGL